MRALEGQRLLHVQHKLGSSPGCVPALQLQPASLWVDDAGLSEALHPGCLLLRVLPEPGTLDPAGGEVQLGGGRHLCAIMPCYEAPELQAPSRDRPCSPVDKYRVRSRCWGREWRGAASGEWSWAWRGGWSDENSSMRDYLNPIFCRSCVAGDKLCSLIVLIGTTILRDFVIECVHMIPDTSPIVATDSLHISALRFLSLVMRAPRWA